MYSKGLCWGGLYVRSNVLWVMVTWHPFPEQIDTTENITFPQLRWRAVKNFGVEQCFHGVMNSGRHRNLTTYHTPFAS